VALRIDGLANDIRAVDDEMPAAALSRSLEDLTAFAGYPLIDVLAGLPPSANEDERLDHFDALATRASRGQVLAVLPERRRLGPVAGRPP
jgi:hypothetical protein